MRLSIHQHDTIALTPHSLRQRQYADSILAIGEGRYDDYAIILNKDFSGSIMAYILFHHEMDFDEVDLEL